MTVHTSSRLAPALDRLDRLLLIGVHAAWLVAGVFLIWATAAVPDATAALAARLDVEYRATLAADREQLRAQFRCTGTEAAQ
ncbi:hypothetical protein, partial [Plasticicumulans sp.]|uniref:hypothetical protein n=1 Tax=Plasticicumulans sp. TaxID=2307179 RepID=UPI00321F66D4